MLDDSLFSYGIAVDYAFCYPCLASLHNYLYVAQKLLLSTCLARSNLPSETESPISVATAVRPLSQLLQHTYPERVFWAIAWSNAIRDLLCTARLRQTHGQPCLVMLSNAQTEASISICNLQHDLIINNQLSSGLKELDYSVYIEVHQSHASIAGLWSLRLPSLYLAPLLFVSPPVITTSHTSNK